MHILFVCLGNICRSPMAESVMAALLDQAGLTDQVSLDSAATSSWEAGKPPHRGTVEELARRGVPLVETRSRPLNEADLQADYIIGMDASNMDDIQAFLAGRSQAVVAPLLTFSGQDRDIADPWYTGDFSQTYQDVLTGCQSLLVCVKARIEERED